MAEAKKAARKTAKKAELIVEAMPLRAEVKEAEKTETLADKIEKPAPKDAAKAGKRSIKSLTAEADKQAKLARKGESSKEGSSKVKAAIKLARPRLERAGKRYREAASLIDKKKLYPLSDALAFASKTSTVKFDAAVELHINLGVDPKVADQNVRGTVVMPAGTGKTVRIAVLAEPEEAEKAKKAGADIFNAEALLAQLDKEVIGFDVLIASPSMMAKIGKYARLLGPRGLMPNPKSGTVTTNTAQAVQEAKAGKVEYRVDQAGIVHLAVGKVSFTPDKLSQNADAVMASVRAAKPASLKGVYIKSLYVSTSMGPGIKVDISGL